MAQLYYLNLAEKGKLLSQMIQELQRMMSLKASRTPGRRHVTVHKPSLCCHPSCDPHLSTSHFPITHYNSFPYPSLTTTHPVPTDVGEDDCFTGQGPPPSTPGYGWVGDLRLDLPVDEDDYLMPSPQPSGLATVGPSHQHYMDLMADAPGKSYLTCYKKREKASGVFWRSLQLS